MISSLTRAGVAVIGYESVAGYGSQGAPLREIARVLDVDAIATGTLLRSGDGIELALEVANPHGETPPGRSLVGFWVMMPSREGGRQRSARPPRRKRTPATCWA
jgi:TolB-like protein